MPRESARWASIGCSAPSIRHMSRRASATDTGLPPGSFDLVYCRFQKMRGHLSAAAYADEYDLDGVEPKGCAAVLGRLDEACRAVGRNPRSIVRSVLATWPWDADPATQRARTTAFADAGVERIHLLAEGWPLDAGLIRRLADVLLVAD